MTLDGRSSGTTQCTTRDSIMETKTDGPIFLELAFYHVIKYGHCLKLGIHFKHVKLPNFTAIHSTVLSIVTGTFPNKRGSNCFCFESRFKLNALCNFLIIDNFEKCIHSFQILCLMSFHLVWSYL